MMCGFILREKHQNRHYSLWGKKKMIKNNVLVLEIDNKGLLS